MPVPTDLADLSTTDASNSPAGGDAVGNTLDNYLRATVGIVRRIFSKGADVASATTLTCPTDGGIIHVTGATTITGFAATNGFNGRPIRVVFDASAQLTHNATSFILPGAQNIQTQAGDTALFIQETSTNWRCISYMRAQNATNAVWVGAEGRLVAGSIASAGTATVDLRLYGVATITHGGTAGQTINVDLTNPPPAGVCRTLVAELTNAGGKTVQLKVSGSNVTPKWAGGSAPTLTTSGLDIITYFSSDGFVTVHALLSSKDSR